MRVPHLLALGYVGTAAALAASAWSSPDQGPGWQEAAALILTLPAMVVAPPVLYVAGATAWNLSGADDGGPMWPVTVVYALVVGVAALGNVLVLRLLLRRALARTPRHPRRAPA